MLGAAGHSQPHETCNFLLGTLTSIPAANAIARRRTSVRFGNVEVRSFQGRDRMAEGLLRSRWRDRCVTRRVARTKLRVRHASRHWLRCVHCSSRINCHCRSSSAAVSLSETFGGHMKEWTVILGVGLLGALAGGVLLPALLHAWVRERKARWASTRASS
jgi:hypothetical protein